MDMYFLFGINTSVRNSSADTLTHFFPATTNIVEHVRQIVIQMPEAAGWSQTSHISQRSCTLQG